MREMITSYFRLDQRPKFGCIRIPFKTYMQMDHILNTH